MLLKLMMELLLSLSPLARTVCRFGLIAGLLIFLLVVLVALLIIAFSPDGTKRLSLILRLLPWTHGTRQTLPSHKGKSRRPLRVHRGHHQQGGPHERAN